jgi:hypothetical protein
MSTRPGEAEFDFCLTEFGHLPCRTPQDGSAFQETGSLDDAQLKQKHQAALQTEALPTCRTPFTPLLFVVK